jgi:hypothetical protein
MSRDDRPDRAPEAERDEQLGAALGSPPESLVPAG